MINNPVSEPLAEQEAEERSQKLIEEFEEHFQECVDKIGPDVVDRKTEVFQAWAIQKISGLQLCVEHIAERINAHIVDEKQF